MFLYKFSIPSGFVAILLLYFPYLHENNNIQKHRENVYVAGENSNWMSLIYQHINTCDREGKLEMKTPNIFLFSAIIFSLATKLPFIFQLHPEKEHFHYE